MRVLMLPEVILPIGVEVRRPSNKWGPTFGCGERRECDSGHFLSPRRPGVSHSVSRILRLER